MSESPLSARRGDGHEREDDHGDHDRRDPAGGRRAQRRVREHRHPAHFLCGKARMGGRRGDGGLEFSAGDAHEHLPARRRRHKYRRRSPRAALQHGELHIPQIQTASEHARERICGAQLR